MVETKTTELAESNERLECALAGLQAAHAFQQSVIDGVAEPILVIGQDYRIRLMNLAARAAAFDEAAPYEPGPREPYLCHRISHQREMPCCGAEHPCPLQEVRSTGRPVTVVHEHTTASGEMRVVEVLASPLYGAAGAFEGIIESIRDITERVRAEKALEAAYAFQQALVKEERQRIARELHDGMAQLLGYVNTKAMAVRLLLNTGQVEAAEQHLMQLEEAARKLFVDVREAILDLKMSGQEGEGLVASLQEFVAQFTRLSGLPVDLQIDPNVKGLPLSAEIDLQMLRIAQEALANVRKHAAATKAWVTLTFDGTVLELAIGDDGRGFVPDAVAPAEWPHIGLSTMRERAQAMGAGITLDTEPGKGTRVVVRLALDSLPPVREGYKES
jgi:signal transduction histidine kinase